MSYAENNPILTMFSLNTLASPSGVSDFDCIINLDLVELGIVMSSTISNTLLNTLACLVSRKSPIEISLIVVLLIKMDLPVELPPVK